MGGMGPVFSTLKSARNMNYNYLLTKKIKCFGISHSELVKLKIQSTS
jgi:hypothetical protein